MFIRHGNAAGQCLREIDHDRPLSDKGVGQAEKRRQKLGNPSFDLVISSSATRCVDTAKIIAGCTGPWDRGEMVFLSRLYLPEDPVIWQTFERIGYAPLREWVKPENDPNHTVLRYGDAAHKIIVALISVTGANNVLVVGHAPLLNAIGVKRHHGWPDNLVECLYDTQFAECEGFLMDGREVTLIQG